MTVVETTVDPGLVQAFTGRILGIYTGALLSYMIDLGHRTGLFTTLASGSGTSEEIASRSGLNERYVREWLAATSSGGLVDFDPTDRTYSFPPERAAVLTDAGPFNMATISLMNTHLGKHLHQVARAFREGGGVPYAEFRPEFTDVMDGIGRNYFDCQLVDAVLPLVPGLREALASGARVADVACGTGHALVVLGGAFPNSTFTGYDLDDGAIARAKAEATGARLGNVSFEVVDAARLTVDAPLDAVLIFDALHDQVDPAGVLGHVFAALKPGGVLVMKEPRAGDALEDNIGNPMAPVMYSISTLHCMTVSLAHGGAGIGTAFGEGLARRLLASAGFEDVEVHPTPADPMDAVYVARKPR